MKRLFILTIFSISCIILFAKGVTQHGIAYLYDYKTKSKKPIAGVSFTVVDAQPTISNNDGTFTLNFESRTIGEKITHSQIPYYKGLKIFNQKVFENWHIVKDTLCLIMCEYEEFEFHKRIYYEQGLKAAKENYDKRLNEIENNHQLNLEQKNRELKQAEEEYQKAMSSLNDISEELARIDQSELDTTMQNVLDLHQKGEISEALSTLNTLKLLERFNEQSKIRNNADENIQTLIKQMRVAIPIFKNSGKLSEAGNCLKRIADETENFDDIFECAAFFAHQNNFKASEAYYNKALSIAYDSKNTYNIAIIKNQLSQIYSNTQRIDKGIDFISESLEILRHYVKENPEAYEDYASSLNSIGMLYNQKQRFDESEKYFLDALKIQRKLVEKDPEQHEASLSIILNNIGIMYSNIPEYLHIGEKYLLEALSILRRLSKEKPREFEPTLAFSLNNIGFIYYRNNHIDKCDMYYSESLEIYHRISKENPIAYEPMMALVLNNIGLLYSQFGKDKIELGKARLESSIEISRRLVEGNPASYEYLLAMGLNNYGLLYFNNELYKECEKYFIEAKEIYSRLVKENPDTHEPNFALILNNIGLSYYYRNDFEKGEKFMQESLKIQHNLSKKNPTAYEPNLALILNNLGLLYIEGDIKDYNKGKKYFTEAIKIQRHLREINQDAAEPQLALYISNLGYLYYYNNNIEKGNKLMIESLEIFKRLAYNYPDTYNVIIENIESVINHFNNNQ